MEAARNRLHSGGIGSSSEWTTSVGASMPANFLIGSSAPRLPIIRCGPCCTLAAVISVNPRLTRSTVARSLKNGMKVLSWWRSRACGCPVLNSSDSSMALRAASSSGVRRLDIVFPKRSISSGASGGPGLRSTTPAVVAGCSAAYSAAR